MSCNLGQATAFLKPMCVPGLLALPVLVVLVTTFYWLWRVRVKRSSPRIFRLSAPALV